GYGDSGINEHLTVGARQHSDVAAGALKDADIAAQLVDLDGRLGGVVTDKVHDVARFGESLSRRKPSAGCRHCARRHAAQTESASRHDVLIEGSHGFLLRMFRKQLGARRGNAASRLLFEM